MDVNAMNGFTELVPDRFLPALEAALDTQLTLYEQYENMTDAL